MKNTLSIKQFRNNPAAVEDGVWETVVDFTEGGKKKGMKAKDFFDLLDKINREDK